MVAPSSPSKTGFDPHLFNHREMHLIHVQVGVVLDPVPIPLEGMGAGMLPSNVLSSRLLNLVMCMLAR